MKTFSLTAAASLFMLLAFTSADALEIETPAVGLTDVPMDYAVTGASPGETVELAFGEQRLTATADADGQARFAGLAMAQSGVFELVADSGGVSESVKYRVIPAWVSTLPAVIAIVIALTLRNVIPALLLGLWIGATALNSFSFKGFGLGLLDSFQVFVRGA